MSTENEDNSVEAVSARIMIAVRRWNRQHFWAGFIMGYGIGMGVGLVGLFWKSG